jgi:tetracycline repressor-like protein
MSTQVPPSPTHAKTLHFPPRAEPGQSVLLEAAHAVAGHVQVRLVAELARLIEEAVQRGEMKLRARPKLVATTIVRLMEGFIYNDAIAAVEPRLDEGDGSPGLSARARDLKLAGERPEARLGLEPTAPSLPIPSEFPR